MDGSLFLNIKSLLMARMISASHGYVQTMLSAVHNNMHYTSLGCSSGDHMTTFPLFGKLSVLFQMNTPAKTNKMLVLLI